MNLSSSSLRMSTFFIFCSNRSFLFKNRIMLVSLNHRLLQISSNRSSASYMRFWPDSSYSTWSYSEMAATKMTAVTSSKQWIHFLRSLRWPPTSKMLRV